MVWRRGWRWGEGAAVMATAVMAAERAEYFTVLLLRRYYYSE